jgi:hypothetical protein
MKPIEEQKTITVYKCPDCKKEHGDETRAEQCCACHHCMGPTTAEDKKIAKGIYRSYLHELLCEWCRVRRDVKSKQDQVRREESHVEQAKSRLAGAERELKKRHDELAALVAKRDALPPKPRQKRVSAEP